MEKKTVGKSTSNWIYIKRAQSQLIEGDLQAAVKCVGRGIIKRRLGWQSLSKSHPEHNQSLECYPSKHATKDNRVLAEDEQRIAIEILYFTIFTR